jgi:hypothetical protein
MSCGMVATLAPGAHLPRAQVPWSAGEHPAKGIPHHEKGKDEQRRYPDALPI